MKNHGTWLNKIYHLIRRMFNSEYDADLDEIERLIDRAEGSLGEVRQAAAAALVQEKALEREVLAAVALVQEWEGRAEGALREGREDEARRAIERKLAYARALKEIRAELARQNQAIAGLRSRAHELTIRLDAARRQRDLIQTRHQRQETEVQIRQAFRRDSVIRNLDQTLGAAVEQGEARDAILETARELEASSLEGQLAQAQVDAELEALRARLDAKK